MMRMTFLFPSIPGGHALRAGPAQSLSPLVSPSEGELAAPLSPPSGSTLDGLGPPSSASATPSAPPPLKDNPSLAEFVPMLTQGWAEIFIRRPSGMQNNNNKWSNTKPLRLVVLLLQERLAAQLILVLLLLSQLLLTKDHNNYLQVFLTFFVVASRNKLVLFVVSKMFFLFLKFGETTNFTINAVFPSRGVANAGCLCLFEDTGKRRVPACSRSTTWR